MYSSVLVPFSFETGRDSKGAIEIAQSICADKGEITLLHVVEHLPEYATSYFSKDFRKNQVFEMKAKLEDMASGISGAATRLVEGHSGRTIFEFAKDNGSDCIVIASHRPGMADLLLGSTATHVVRHAPCSVHVIR